VYQADGTTLVCISHGAGNSEQVSLNGQPAGTFYAYVYGCNHAVNPSYTLTIHPGTVADDAYEDNDNIAVTLLAVADDSQHEQSAPLSLTVTLIAPPVNHAPAMTGFETTSALPIVTGQTAMLAATDADGTVTQIRCSRWWSTMRRRSTPLWPTCPRRSPAATSSS
jgi:hypothetical protein